MARARTAAVTCIMCPDKTHAIMTHDIMTHDIMTHDIMTHDIMTHDIRHHDTRHHDARHASHYLHHMPDLLRLAAVYQLVEGEQPLGVRPPGEQRYLEGDVTSNSSNSFNSWISSCSPSPVSPGADSPCPGSVVFLVLSGWGRV